MGFIIFKNGFVISRITTGLVNFCANNNYFVMLLASLQKILFFPLFLSCLKLLGKKKVQCVIACI